MAQSASNLFKSRFLVGFELNQDIATAFLDDVAD
jgi:hypothetical protein